MKNFKNFLKTKFLPKYLALVVVILSCAMFFMWMFSSPFFQNTAGFIRDILKGVLLFFLIINPLIALFWCGEEMILRPKYFIVKVLYLATISLVLYSGAAWIMEGLSRGDFFEMVCAFYIAAIALCAVESLIGRFVKPAKEEEKI